MMELSVVILAAGKGTRMKSVLPKVMQPLAGRPLLRHVVATAQALQAARSGGRGVTDAVLAFAQARWARNARVQQRAARNGEIFHARGWWRWGRDVGLRVLGARLMDVPWLYGRRF